MPVTHEPERLAIPNVCAIVVTHNRKELLSQCLDRLQMQSRPPDRILVIDNASNDGTEALLAAREGIDVLRLAENGGGAGGFENGLREARVAAHDWYWLMDDDTFADERCLEALLDGADRAPSRPAVLASVVRWKDGRLHPMNFPRLRIRQRGDFAIGASRGLALIRTSTFVSTLVHRDAIDRFGLPPGHYFIWSDDVQYTGRILREGVGYMVPDSTVDHWTPKPHDTVTDARERFYFRARNQLWLLRGDSFTVLERLQLLITYVASVNRYLRHSRPRGAAVNTVLRGVRDGLGPEPR